MADHFAAQREVQDIPAFCRKVDYSLQRALKKSEWWEWWEAKIFPERKIDKSGECNE
jgi:hypothetical protein